VKKIMKEGDRRKDAKKGFTEMNKDRKVKNPVQGKVVQRDLEIMKKAMQKRGSREAKANMNEGQEKDDLPRIEIRYLMLTRHLPIGETLLLNQPLIGQLLQILLLGGRDRLDRYCSLNGEELHILDHLKNLILVNLNDLLAA
jgi:hypothetical protein